MRPDPGRAQLEAGLAALTPDDRARIAADLRARGFALAWDQLDRATPMGPVERAMFLIGRLYPEMPEVHRQQVSRKLQLALDAGTWTGPTRPPPLPGG